MASTVWEPDFSTFTNIAFFLFIVPAKTFEPTDLRTGEDSPPSIRSSIKDSPSIIVPSAAILSFGPTYILSPRCKELTGESISIPSSIITLAFTPGSVAGGLTGQGIIIAAKFGIARGLFSNESGLGSAPLVASAAQTKNPVRQALVSATGTFWDTVVFCLITGIVIVSTVMKYPEVHMINFQNGGQMTTAAFNQIPYFGSFILIVALTTFAYSTILGWSYYGERCAEYLFGRKAILPYKLLYVAVLVFAPVLALDMVWTIADILNAFMAVPNLIAVLLLASHISKDTKFYIENIDHIHKEEIPVIDK